jgi:hypothetical protein
MLRLAIDTYAYTAAVTVKALRVSDRRLFLRAKIKNNKTQAKVFEYNKPQTTPHSDMARLTSGFASGTPSDRKW